jgi:hypothetical protein
MDWNFSFREFRLCLKIRRVTLRRLAGGRFIRDARA